MERIKDIRGSQHNAGGNFYASSDNEVSVTASVRGRLHHVVRHPNESPADKLQRQPSKFSDFDGAVSLAQGRYHDRDRTWGHNNSITSG